MKGFIVLHCLNSFTSEVVEVDVDLSTIKDVVKDSITNLCFILFREKVVFKLNKYRIKSDCFCFTESYDDLMQLKLLSEV